MQCVYLLWQSLLVCISNHGFLFYFIYFYLQAHHVTWQVEYRGDVISLTEALVGFPAGGQVLLSDATYQRIYGRLHTVNFTDQKKKGVFRRKRKMGKSLLMLMFPCCHCHLVLPSRHCHLVLPSRYTSRYSVANSLTKGSREYLGGSVGWASVFLLMFHCCHSHLVLPPTQWCDVQYVLC